MTFRGSNAVTIPAGEEVWSDSVHLAWVRDADDPAVQGRNLAISYSIQGDSGHMTYHSGANQTSFITAPNSGDHTRDASGFAYVFTTTSWFFLTAVDVMAPPDTVVICAFGDSITDGTHTTLNINDRWSNVLSRRLHNAYGSKVSIVNEAIGGNRVVNPVVANATAGPAAVDRLDRDVLALSGLTQVIWVEGFNDLGAAHPTDDIIAGYKDVVGRLHVTAIAPLPSRFARVRDPAGAGTQSVASARPGERRIPHPRAISGRRSSSRVATIVATPRERSSISSSSACTGHEAR